MSQPTEVQVKNNEWIVVDAAGVRQNRELLTEQQADALIDKSLKESGDDSGKRLHKKRYLAG